MQQPKNDKPNENINNENPKIIQLDPILNDQTDISVTKIVDKIIAGAVINSNIKHIYDNLNSYCFDCLNKLIDPYLASDFLFYENGIEDMEYQKKQLYYKSEHIKKINTWVAFQEPKNNEIDRCENANTKIKKRKKADEISEGMRESVASNQINVLKSIEINDESELNINNISNKPTKKQIISNITNNKNISPKNNNKNLNKKQETNNKKNDKVPEENEIVISKRKENEILTDLPVFELSKDKYENVYSLINSNDENNKLRKERELQIIQKEEKKRIEQMLEEDEKKRAYKKAEREFDNNRLTFDPNGQIISLRFQNVDNFEKDFLFSRFKIKNKDSKQRKSITQLSDIIYPVEGQENPEINNLNVIKETKRSTKKNDIKDKILSDLSKIKVEKNKDKNGFWNNNPDSLAEKMKKEIVIPSGTNFDKIVPETGVIISGGQNNRSKKEGGFDYIKKYNKFSMNEFSKFVESVNNSKNLSSSIINNENENNDNDYNDYNDYIGYKEEFNDNNPLIQNAHQFSTPSKDNSNTINIFSDRRHLLKSCDKVRKNNGLYNSIKLSGNVNLEKMRSIMYDDYKTFETESNNENKKSSYFSRAILPYKNLKYKSTNKRNSIDEINLQKGKYSNVKMDEKFLNNFNSQIIKNKDWGNEDYDETKIKDKLNNENNSRRFRVFRRENNQNRLKEYGMRIMTENNRERKIPVYPGHL